MGYSITWLAVPEAHAEDFLRRLHLEHTGETTEVPEEPLCLGQLDTGWRVLWSNERHWPSFSKSEQARLSESHDLLICDVEEHSMVCSASLWREGQLVWSIYHDGSGGPKGLEVSGEPPHFFPEIRDQMFAQQVASGGMKAGVDHYFEIPLLTAERLTGFKHDENWPHLIGDQFEVLRRSPNAPAPEKPPRRSFFKKLFGRK